MNADADRRGVKEGELEVKEKEKSSIKKCVQNEGEFGWSGWMG